MSTSFSPRRRSAISGFTLIELLVVISIIAVLAGLLLPVVSSVMQNAHKTEAKTTENMIVSAVKNYYTEYGQYPVEAQNPATDVTFDNKSGTNTNGGALCGHNVTLFDVLRANNSTSNHASGDDQAVQALNSRQIIYFEANDVKTPSNARSGFIPVGANGVKGNPKNTNVVPMVGDLVDPWGNLYYVRIDSNYSSILENPYNMGTSDSGSAISYGGDGASDPVQTGANQAAPNPMYILRTDVIAWSPGLDGYMGTQGGGTGISPTSTGDDVLSWQ